MNKARAKRLAILQERIGDLKQEAEELRDEEQAAFDNMPEQFQETDNGLNMQETIDALDQMVDLLDEAFGAVSA